MDFTALIKKLCFILFVWVLMFLYVFREGRGREVSWVGGVCNYTTSSCLNPGCCILSPGVGEVVFTTWAKSFLSCAGQLSYHTVALRQRRLSVVSLKTFVEAEGGSLLLLSFLRKKNLLPGSLCTWIK